MWLTCTCVGAFFGTSFAPLFFQTFPELLSVPFYAASPPSHSASRPISPSPSPTPVGGETLINPNPHGGQKTAFGKVYIPRIYGFKVSEHARNGPRMKWLRERPVRWDELDTVDWKGKFKGDPDADEDMSDEDEDEDEEENEGEGGKDTTTAAATAGKSTKKGKSAKKATTTPTVGKAKSGQKGKLFDDEDDDPEEEDDEEEEEDAVGVTTGQSVKTTPATRP